MCGRFVMVTDLGEAGEALGVELVTARSSPSYNITPGRDIAVVADRGDGRALVDMRWGLPLPNREGKGAGGLLINARSETIDRKPVFREAFQKRRCLVVANGYYEWQRREKNRSPWYFRHASGEIMGFAAVWTVIAGKDGTSRPACAIITTEANSLAMPVHHRMPAILMPEQFVSWLDMSRDGAFLKGLLKPRPPGEMRAWEVSRAVNSPRHDESSCIAPL